MSGLLCYQLKKFFIHIEDEYGTAAYKTVECDEILDGAAIQHREIQGKESAKFREYFGGKLKYLEGGVESGFNHVEEEEFEVSIYQIKGTRGMVEIKEVALSRDQMNEGMPNISSYPGHRFLHFAPSLWSGFRCTET